MCVSSGASALKAPSRCVQTLGDTRASEYMKGRKTLEINPDHPIITALQDKVSADAEGAKVRPLTPRRARAMRQSLTMGNWHGLLGTHSFCCHDGPCVIINEARNLWMDLARWSQAKGCVTRSRIHHPGPPASQAMAELLYDTALVTSGFSVDSPKDFAARIFSMMGLAVGAPASNGAPQAAQAQPEAEVVEPEVLGADGDDPWRK